MQYLKRKHFSYRIQFHTEKVWFIWKNLKKSNFSDFFFKTDADHLSSFANFSNLYQQISQICTKKFQNWVYLCFRKVLKLKVTKRELIISNHLEIMDNYLLGEMAATPPALIGVKVPWTFSDFWIPYRFFSSIGFLEVPQASLVIFGFL